MYLCSALDRSAATTILSALASRRGSQVVRSRSAKPLFAGSIPAPASRSRSVSLDNEALLLCAGSIDSLASRRAHPSGFVYVARLPPAPFPPPPRDLARFRWTTRLSCYAPVRLIRSPPVALTLRASSMSLGSPRLHSRPCLSSKVKAPKLAQRY